MARPNVDKILTTERLILTPLTIADAQDLHLVFRDEEAMRFMPTPPHQNIQHTQLHLATELGNRAAKHWAVRLASDAPAIGIVNYLGGTVTPGLGYILSRDHWGKGITTEACRAAIEYGFTTLGHKQIELWIDERNAASRRVATKLGFGLKGRIPLKYAHRSAQHMMMTYGLWEDEWKGEHVPAPLAFHSVQPVLMVHDVRKSAEFYQDKLGFRIDFLYGEPADHAGISKSDWTGTGVTIQLSRVPAERTLSTSTYLYIFVSSDIALLQQRCIEHEVEILSQLESYPWGMREFTIRDLDGHVLRFGTHG